VEVERDPTIHQKEERRQQKSGDENREK